jgi:hypothetical protein
MKTAETVFVIPTYRLRDVAETIETYDEHFWADADRNLLLSQRQKRVSAAKDR